LAIDYFDITRSPIDHFLPYKEDRAITTKDEEVQQPHCSTCGQRYMTTL
jgi:hypothetical protein